ncbi:MAG TPA: response regulator transcription factor [Pseudonocardiaceae bacterium]|jgi:DNA-binding NarL/FixJ family response regulator|nr:response regulator transcription factor [Pseudonocardiaceae bacterium]
MIRIAAIDNDPMVLLGQRALIDPVPDLSIVATSTTVDAHLASKIEVDVVLLDLMLDDGHQPEDNVRTLVATGAKVLVASVHGDRQHVRATIRAGASGYLIKGGDQDVLADAIRTVHAGEQALTQELAFIISLEPPRLTQRELEVLSLYGTGSTLEATARRLGISVSTVRVHLSRIYAKFAAAGDPVGDRSDLVHRLPDYGLTDRNPTPTGNPD